MNHVARSDFGDVYEETADYGGTDGCRGVKLLGESLQTIPAEPPMSLAQCTKCSEEVLIPAGVSSKAIVQCPLCEEELPLSEVLSNMPPTFVVVSDPGGAAVAESAGGFSIGEADTPAAESAGFSFDPTGGDSTGEAPTPSLAAPAARSRKKKAPPKSAVFEIIKIVGGGVAGILLAIMIIWWGVGTDPFGFADDVAKYVPFLVPAKLHGEPAPSTDSGEPQDEGNNNNKPQNTANQNNQKNGKGGNQQANNNKQPDPNAFKQPLSSGTDGFNPDIVNLDGDPLSLDSTEPIAGDASEFNPLDTTELPADSSELNPDLNPDLGDLNPDLGDLNPDLKDLNPKVDPEGDPESDPEGDPEADPESDPEAAPER